MLLKKVKEKERVKLLDKLYKYKIIVSYYGKCNWFQKIMLIKQWYCQNVEHVVLQNQDLLRNKKQIDYLVV